MGISLSLYVPSNLEGNLMDGKFEIVVIKNINLNSLVKAGLLKFDENFHDSQNGMVVSTSEADTILTQPRNLQLNGDAICNFEKLKIIIIKGTVNLITHHDDTYLAKK